MLVLETIRHDTIWGGAKITEYTGVEGDSIGHLYSVFCRESISNTILNGEWSNKSVNDVFSLFKESVGMKEYDYFPLTIALTSADINLSIQVHPNDEMAESLENEKRGKRESWYFIEAPIDGYIINGCKCHSESQKERMLSEGKYLEICDSLFVKKGDYVFVEPGTLHSITAGSLVYEIEEGADCTYRFYDYDRIDRNGEKRELQIDKASIALDIELKSYVRKYQNEDWIDEKTYSTRKIENVDTYVNTSDELNCLTLVKGDMNCDGVDVTPGMTVLLWPGEIIENANIKMAFVAKLREDNV